MHYVCCFCWCRRILSWMVVVWLEFVSLISCILPALHRFHAATYHQQLQIQTSHIGRWLTSIKYRCKVDVHWFNKLFWPIRTSRILQPWIWLKICKCQQTTTLYQRSMIGLAGNEPAFVHVAISVLYGNSVSVFEEYGHTSILPAHFHTNTVKYGRVGRSVMGLVVELSASSLHHTLGLVIVQSAPFLWPGCGSICLFPLPHTGLGFLLCDSSVLCESSLYHT